jgi:glyoxylase-like metal-dependent hydrolase (beta-lactamase superfamily II)
VGEIAVTAIADGYIDMPLSLFPRTPEAEGRAILVGSPQARPLRGHVNAYLVDTPDRRILVDAGGVAAAFPGLGRLPATLRAAGVAPESVDAIVMTHLHIDHVGGLFGPDGAAAFPKAELVLAEAEHGFWTDPGLLSRATPDFRPLVEAAQGALALYAGRTTPLSGEREVAPGLTLTPAYGHTPGHSAVRLESGGAALLIWGDIVHAPAMQFARPDWTIAFDVDPDAAVRTRARLLDAAATDRLAVAGMHLPFPGRGYVRRDGGGYAYEAAWFEHDA